MVVQIVGSHEKLPAAGSCRLHVRPHNTSPGCAGLEDGAGHAGEAKNTDYYEVIIFTRPPMTSVKEFYVNLTTRGKGKRLGIVPLSEPFVMGAYVDLELSVVGQHLQVSVNGKVAFEIDDSGLSNGGYWGVAALEAWFSNIQVRSLPRDDGTKLPKSNDPRVIQLDEAYESAIQRDVTQAHVEAIQALDAKYLAALDRALDATTAAGNLDSALAVRTEKKRVEDQAPLPADDSTADESLKPLRVTYRASVSQLETQREQTRQSLREKYLQALASHEEELTRAKNLDAALEVRKRREFEAAKGRQ